MKLEKVHYKLHNEDMRHSVIAELRWLNCFVFIKWTLLEDSENRKNMESEIVAKT